MAKHYQKRKWEVKSKHIVKRQSAPAVVKKKYILPHIETYRNKKYFILRDRNNKVVQKRMVKGSGLTLNEARELYKRNRTFYENIRATKLKNVTEYYYFQKSSNSNTKTIAKPPVRINKKWTYQYIIEGYYMFRGKRLKLYGSSASYSMRGNVNGEHIYHEKQARNDALISFYANIGKVTSGISNEDEGLNAMENGKVTITHEGWKWYR